jgi:hypothetical protein
VWATIALGVILVINLVIFLVLGFWNPIVLLIAMSNLTFFEAGVIMVIGGIALMIGGFPSIGRTLYNEWNPEKAKETREMSYTPHLCLSVNPRNSTTVKMRWHFHSFELKKKGGGRLDVGERCLLTFSSKDRLQ